jgi:glycolate oxidase FAD binding subunit
VATTAINMSEQLAAIIGAEHVRDAGDIVTVAPANTQQVSEVMRFANENGLVVTPVGGGTKQGWGNPVQAQIHLSLARLTRILEHPWEDLTCTVQAGCTWTAMQQTLAKYGQFVALDPLWPEAATVGGILATNDSGALRHKYGSLRDLVIGMTLVLADGTIAKSGGKVVKNVAGYDLCKLMTGSFGTLAVITEATFRLHPLPQHAQNFTVPAPRATQLAPLMQAIRESHLLTQALQLRGDGSGFNLDIQLNAHPEARQHEILAAMVTGFGFTVAECGDEVWSRREALFTDDATVVKVGVAPTSVCAYAEQIFAGVAVASISQALGIGLMQLRGAAADVARAIEAMHLQATQVGANVTMLSMPHTSIDRWGTASSAVPLMRSVKHQFDPNSTLNPGRMLGGI